MPSGVVKMALIAAIGPLLVALALGLIEHFLSPPKKITFQLGADESQRRAQTLTKRDAVPKP